MEGRVVSPSVVIGEESNSEEIDLQQELDLATDTNIGNQKKPTEIQ